MALSLTGSLAFPYQPKGGLALSQGTAYDIAIDSQIQLYHDLTLAWVDKEWKTPKQKKLEKPNNELYAQNQQLKAQLQERYNQGYQEAKAKYLVTFHCRGCRQLIEVAHDNTKQAARQYLEQHGWGHSGC